LPDCRWPGGTGCTFFIGPSISSRPSTATKPFLRIRPMVANYLFAETGETLIDAGEINGSNLNFLINLS